MTIGNDGISNEQVQRRAFTLVELLVVISIIALLLAILLPALGGARDTARKATTETTIRDVLNSTQQFQIDNNRAPGRFGATVMGSRENGEKRGFTAMENALLELMGGIVEDDSISPTNIDDPYIEVGPYDTDRDRNVIVDTLELASARAGYLSLGSNVLYAVGGQLAPMETDWYEVDEDDRPKKGMPDVVDAWGQPLLLWTPDPGASLEPEDESDIEYFAHVDVTAAGNRRPAFYWASNAGYLSAGKASATPIRATLGLGDGQINQWDRSRLGGPTAEVERLSWSLAGVLGSPAYPLDKDPDATSEPWRPSRPRGEVVIVSAGSDQIYFARREGTGTRVAGSFVGYATAGNESGQAGNAGELAPPPNSKQFDDIVRSAGG